MKLVRYFGGLLCGMFFALSGCGVPGVPKPPSLDLPQPVTDLRAVRKGDNVYLAWTVPVETTDHRKIRHLGVTRICRSADTEIRDCANPAAQAAVLLPLVQSGQTKTQSATKIQASYTDSLPRTLLSPAPGAQISYALSVQNENERSAGLSNTVHLSAVITLPPPDDFRGQVTAEGVILSWTGIPHPPETPGLRRIYRVYRREEGSEADMVAGELPLGTLRSYVLLDHSFEWEKTYFYRAAVVTLIHAEGKEDWFGGDDTAAVKVFTHDVFPPVVPSGLQAVFSGAGQPPFIDLIWAPDTDADLAGYNVFRHESGGEPAKINAELVKTPAFRDTNVASGRTYFYSVSALDVRGNESARSEEASEAVP